MLYLLNSEQKSLAQELDLFYDRLDPVIAKIEHGCPYDSEEGQDL